MVRVGLQYLGLLVCNTALVVGLGACSGGDDAGGSDGTTSGAGSTGGASVTAGSAGSTGASTGSTSDSSGSAGSTSGGSSSSSSSGGSSSGSTSDASSTSDGSTTSDTTGGGGECHHSVGPWSLGGVEQMDMGGCMQACKNATACEIVADMMGESDPCQQICDAACPNVMGSDDRLCCDVSFCEAENWCLQSLGMGKRKACYEGDAQCSPVVCAKNF